MASTFDNDLRLEEMATGENAGSWGTKTNTNLELIADAFGYGTFTIADADTTLTIPDGSGSDNALRSLYLKISSSADLTTTRVLTIDPNTVNKLWYIENNTSGGQTITISQGSGANISILNGQAKLVATDGVGAGAAVIDLTDDLAIKDLFVDENISMQSDGAAINFGTDAEIQLTHVADTGLLLTETGGGAPTLQIRDSALSISSSADGQLDIDADTEVQITAPTVDIDASTEVNISGDLKVDTDTLYVDSTNNRVGVGTTSPTNPLQVNGSSGQLFSALADSGSAIVRVDSSGAGSSAYFWARATNTGDSAIQFGDTDDADVGRITYDHTDNSLAFRVNTVDAITIDSSQRVLFGTDSTSQSVASGVAPVQSKGTAAASYSALRYTSASSGPFFMFGKTRSTTEGTIGSIVSENDDLGTIRFAGDDGNDLNSWGAAIRAEVDGAPAENSMPGRLSFETTADGSSSATERMRISEDGTVSIGYAGSNPSLLRLRQETDTSANDGTGILAIQGGASTYSYWMGLDATGFSLGSTSTSRGMRFVTNSSTAITIDTSQRVLIGDDSSVAVNGFENKLQVSHTGYATASLAVYRNGSDGAGLNFAHSRSATIGTNTILQDGDAFGHLYFNGADGTDFATRGAAIVARVDGTPGSNDMPGRIEFLTTADGASSVTERMRIDSTGQVILYGNGATTMHLQSTSPILAFTDTNDFADANDRVQIRATRTNSTDNLAIQFYDDSASSTSTLASFFSDGVVSFGNATPTVTGLQIGGDAITTLNPTVVISKADSGGTDTSVVIRGGSPTLAFDNTGGGNATILTDNSVLRIKDGDLDNQGTILAAFTTTGFAVGTGGGTQLYSASTELASPLHIVNTSDSGSFASVQQTINGSITSGASGAWKDICRVDHTCSLNVQLLASDTGGVSVGSAHLNGTVGVAYGGGTQDNVSTSGYLSGGNISGIDFRYLNGSGTSGTSYVLQAQVTYTGSAKTVYFNVSGMSVGRIYPV